MKKLSVLCLAVICFYACSKREKITVIEEFYNPITSTITPKEKGSYTVYRIEIKGEVNDSVFFTFSDGGLPFYFSGKIDYTIPIDYYGGISQKLTFKPYKATKGKLVVTQILQ